MVDINENFRNIDTDQENYFEEAVCEYFSLGEYVGGFDQNIHNFSILTYNIFHTQA